MRLTEKVRLEYRWVPNWQYDPFEGYYTVGFSTQLCYWDEQLQKWKPIPVQEFPNTKEGQLEIILEHTDVEDLKVSPSSRPAQHHYGWTGREIIEIQKEREKKKVK